MHSGFGPCRKPGGGYSSACASSEFAGAPELGALGLKLLPPVTASQFATQQVTNRQRFRRTRACSRMIAARGAGRGPAEQYCKRTNKRVPLPSSAGRIGSGRASPFPTHHQHSSSLALSLRAVQSAKLFFEGFAPSRFVLTRGRRHAVVFLVTVRCVAPRWVAYVSCQHSALVRAKWVRPQYLSLSQQKPISAGERKHVAAAIASSAGAIETRV